LESFLFSDFGCRGLCGRHYLSMSLFMPLNITLSPFRIYGGVDGARTRDLRRDSELEMRNLLETGVADGSFSALRHPWEHLLHPYRTHVLCPLDLCLLPTSAPRLRKPPSLVCRERAVGRGFSNTSRFPKSAPLAKGLDRDCCLRIKIASVGEPVLRNAAWALRSEEIVTGRIRELIEHLRES
jgi:hypothetical protein